jgi:hypothetical protein
MTLRDAAAGYLLSVKDTSSSLVVHCNNTDILIKADERGSAGSLYLLIKNAWIEASRRTLEFEHQMSLTSILFGFVQPHSWYFSEFTQTVTRVLDWFRVC